MTNDGNSFVLTGLVRKRAELAGDIERTQSDIQRMIGELEALDQTIRLFDANYHIEAIRPKTFRPPKDWANRGEMTRIVLTDIPHMTGVGAPDWAISACRATLDAGRGAKDARHEPRRLAASP